MFKTQQELILFMINKIFMICLGLLLCLSSCADHADETLKPIVNDEAELSPNMSGAPTVTYVRFGGDADVLPHYSLYLPVSYMKDGVQLFTEENWQKTFARTDSMYMTSGDFEKAMKNAPAADDINKIDGDAMYALGRNEHMNSIASNGSWDFFPVKVVYEKYTLEIQPDRAEWNDYFKGQIEWPTYLNGTLSMDVPLSAPVVIAESWTFAWNGMETALVTSSNAILIGEYGEDAGVAPNPPPSGNTIMYTISALFVGDQPPILLHERYSALNGAYIPHDDFPFPYSQYISAVQIDENGELMLCPIFSYDITGDTSDYILSFKPEYMICDIEGDGQAELIQYTNNHGFSSLFCNYSVWKLIDGEPTRVFAMMIG